MRCFILKPGEQLRCLDASAEPHIGLDEIRRVPQKYGLAETVQFLEPHGPLQDFDRLV